MRSPLTGIVFALELTHDVNTLPAAADRRHGGATGSPCCA